MNSSEAERMVVVQVRLFARMAQEAGVSTLPLNLPEGSRVEEALAELKQRALKGLWSPSTMIAVNQEYVTDDTLLKDGDELAIIPPVSGG